MPGFYSLYCLLESQGEVTGDTKRRVFDKITTEGMPVNRGVRPIRSERGYATDPGDFGRGIYYDTSFHRAKSYGKVATSILKLKNPLVLTAKEAYALAEWFHTVKLDDDVIHRLATQARSEGKRPEDTIREELVRNAKAMTDWMLSSGHDGLAAIGSGGSIEIVDYRPYIKSPPHLSR